MAARLLLQCRSSWSSMLAYSSSRQLTVAATLYAKNNKPIEDPVKKLFLEKIQEYRTKSKGGQPPDVTPEAQARLSDELARLQRIYGDGDLSKFPTFEFKDPQPQQ